VNWLTDYAPDIKIAATAAVAAMSCALPGVWLLLRRQSMMGDALSHTALPGTVIAFLVAHWIADAGWMGPVGTGSALHVAMFVGAVVIGLLTSLVTELVQKLGAVESGAALGVVFTWFFALGLFLMRLLADSVHIDPDCVLFGLLENVVWEDGIPRAVRVNGTALLLNLILLVVFYKELKLAAFDPALATTLGVNAHVMHYCLMAATAVTVVAAFESVGSILVIGLLITPAATAFLLTNRLKTMIILSLLIAAFSGVMGHLLARTLPPLIFPPLGFTEVEDVLTSGMVPIVAAVLFVLAWLFSPRHGVVGTLAAQARLAVRIAGDDLLGLLYRMEEHNLDASTSMAPALVSQRLGLGRWLQFLTVRRLRSERFITAGESGYELTSRGREAAQKLVRAHRLWETYLQKHFAIPQDHLHAAAHRAEHYIDEQIETELTSELESPAVDPHGTPIPRDVGSTRSKLPHAPDRAVQHDGNPERSASDLE
jgi:manganese/zinc/iron transport system permease protein